MQIKVTPNARTAMATGYGPFFLDTQKTFKEQKSQLDLYIDELKNLRVAMIPGGIGRLTHYAREQGVDAWCIDASKVCQGLCQQIYPSVPFLLQDMSIESTDWDACFLEDNIHTSSPSLILKLAYNWQKACTVYPKQYEYCVIRFNSSHLDERFEAIEEIGQKYFNKLLSTGEVNIGCSLSDFDMYDLETITVDLNRKIHDINHQPILKYKYTAVGQKTSTNRWLLRIWNSGYKDTISINSRHVIPKNIPELVK